MRKRPKTLVKALLVLAVAWSTLGIEVRTCSGPLAPDSCLHALCAWLPPCLEHAGADRAAAPLSRPPENDSDPTDGETPPESPSSLFVAIWPAPVTSRNQRRLPLQSTHHASRIRGESAGLGWHAQENARAIPYGFMAGVSFQFRRLLC